MSVTEEHRPRRFSAEGDFVGRLEGPERRRLIPPGGIVASLRLSRSDVLLDLGAGIGYLSLPASRRAGRVIALDVEPRMFHVLAERMASSGVRNIELVRGDMLSMPLAEGSVNHVLAAFVYHEVDDPRELMAECARVLVPEGHLTIVDFQKRETPIGPPVEERKTPRDVLRSSSRSFELVGRLETEVYYSLRFRKR